MNKYFFHFFSFFLIELNLNNFLITSNLILKPHWLFKNLNYNLFLKKNSRFKRNVDIKVTEDFQVKLFSFPIFVVIFLVFFWFWGLVFSPSTFVYILLNIYCCLLMYLFLISNFCVRLHFFCQFSSIIIYFIFNQSNCEIKNLKKSVFFSQSKCIDLIELDNFSEHLFSIKFFFNKIINSLIY